MELISNNHSGKLSKFVAVNIFNMETEQLKKHVTLKIETVDPLLSCHT